jgi:tRNA A37 threonylcarbamoyladenosine dehydratase
MTTQMATILTAFNDHFMEFVNDIHSVVPENTDILAAKNSFTLIRKANPKMIIKIWQSYVVNKYNDKIDAGNISFFVNKDYGDDLTNADNSDKIVEAIDRLRSPIKLMSVADQAKTMKYIQNLKKLSNMYHALQ